MKDQVTILEKEIDALVATLGSDNLDGDPADPSDPTEEADGEAMDECDDGAAGE